MAARLGHEAVQHQDFTDSLERIVLGAARRIVLSEEDRRRTAFHESGHGLLGMLEPGADPVRKISIILRGHALLHRRGWRTLVRDSALAANAHAATSSASGRYWAEPENALSDPTALQAFAEPAPCRASA